MFNTLSEWLLYIFKFEKHWFRLFLNSLRVGGGVNSLEAVSHGEKVERYQGGDCRIYLVTVVEDGDEVLLLCSPLYYPPFTFQPVPGGLKCTAGNIND